MAEKRFTINFNFGPMLNVPDSPLSVKRFYDRFTEEKSYSAKRSLMTDMVRGGTLLNESGLSSVMAYLDTPAFHASTREQKQARVINALLDFIGSTPSPELSEVRRVAIPESSETDIPAAPTPPAEESAEIESASLAEVQSDKPEVAEKKPAVPKISAVFKGMGN